MTPHLMLATHVKMELKWFLLNYSYLGRYPETHGIIGNQFWDQSNSQDRSREFFDHMDERTTQKLKWYSTNEPIWVTAKKQHVKFNAFLWAR